MNANEVRNLQAILASSSYRPAEMDMDFLQRDELRPVRLLLELLKPELIFQEDQVKSTIVVLGGTQIVERQLALQQFEAAEAALAKATENRDLRRALARAERILAKSEYYEAAREFGRIVSTLGQADGAGENILITGGGPGIMEAVNRGAFDVHAKSIGLNIALPDEQDPNAYVTPSLCFQFRYFSVRKMHFLMRAKAVVVFPGGFGTLDELFDALTLRQTNRMQNIPIILFAKAYWERAIDFQFLANEGVIEDEHLDLIDYAETSEEVWGIITEFYKNGKDTTD